MWKKNGKGKLSDIRDNEKIILEWNIVDSSSRRTKIKCLKHGFLLICYRFCLSRHFWFCSILWLCNFFCLVMVLSVGLLHPTRLVTVVVPIRNNLLEGCVSSFTSIIMCGSKYFPVSFPLYLYRIAFKYLGRNQNFREDEGRKQKGFYAKRRRKFYLWFYESPDA